MKKTTVLILMLFVSTLYSQITLIPDEFFEHHLVTAGIDSDGIINGQVLTSDIADETQLTINLGNQITDLTGIEDFESLEILDIAQMDITEINLSQNFNLIFLNIQDVSLESLNIGSNTNLNMFFLQLNSEFGSFNSPITNIDFSNNISLKLVSIYDTFITELDLVNNINLDQLGINDMSDLTYVNIKNGVNHELGFVEIFNNSSLQCLQVDDPAAVIAGVTPPYDSWFFENNPNLVITDDCSLGINTYLDIQIKIYPNPTQDLLYIENNSSFLINTLKMYDVLGRQVLLVVNPNSQIDISSLSSGFLFVKLETEQGMLTKKIIKN